MVFEERKREGVSRDQREEVNLKAPSLCFPFQSQISGSASEGQELLMEHISAGVVLIRVLHCKGKVMQVLIAFYMIQTETKSSIKEFLR